MRSDDGAWLASVSMMATPSADQADGS
jgi:hypothetical protein